MPWLKWTVLVLLALPVLAIVAGQLGFLHGSKPAHLGLRDGRFEPPSGTDNSVNSQADLWPDHPQRAAARLAPLALVAGSGPATMAKLQRIVQGMPGAQVASAGADYLHVQFTTRLMKYTDDAEFWFDPIAQVVQVRSASRLGRKDFGANRQRIEAIRAALLAP